MSTARSVRVAYTRGTMHAGQRALALRSTGCCQHAAASHSGSAAACRPLAGIPFTASRTLVVCAAKKGKAAQAKRKSATKQKKPAAPPAPTPHPPPTPAVPKPEPLAAAAAAPAPATATAPPAAAAPTEPEPAAPASPPPPADPAQPSPEAAPAASAPIDPVPTQSGTRSVDAPVGGAPVGGSSAAEEQPEAVTAAAAAAAADAATAAAAPQQPSVPDAQPTTAPAREGILSEAEIQQLAQLKREQERGLLPDSNLLQGAAQEIGLITWPTPAKALADTVLVVAIVAATGVLLFGYNILLSQTAEWWYHTPHPDWLK